MKLLASAVLASFVSSFAQASLLFDFDNAPNMTSLPLYQTVGGLTAHFVGTGQNFSIQSANVLGFTPQGFAGRCIYPNSIFAADLQIDFSQMIKDISIMYSPEEYGSDTSATMRVTAYRNGSLVGFHDTTAPNPGTWPTGTLAYANNLGFNYVVVHYQAPPVGGENWGPIFMADNMVVTPVPEPANLVVLGFGSMALIYRMIRKRRSHQT